MVCDMMRENTLKRALTNSRAIYALYTIVGGIISALIWLVSFYVQIRGLPDRVAALEAQQSATEIAIATYMAETKAMLQNNQNDLNIIKTQITKLGMEHPL